MHFYNDANAPAPGASADKVPATQQRFAFYDKTAPTQQPPPGLYNHAPTQAAPPPPQPAAPTEGQQEQQAPAQPWEKLYPTMDAARELELPEGADGNDPGWQAYRKVAKEIGLDKAKNSKLMGFYQEQARRQTAEVNRSWRAQVERDPEIGGKNLAESVNYARGVMERFGTPALAQFMNSPAGNHPEVLRLLARVGRELKKK